MKFEMVFATALAKVFSDQPFPAGNRYRSDTALRGEVFHYQVVCLTDTPLVDIVCEVESTLPARVRRVEDVPVRYTGYMFDDDILRRTPGLYPDVLAERGEHPWRSAAFVPQAFWVTVTVPSDAAAGRVPVRTIFRLRDRFGKRFRFRKTFSLTVLPLELPPQKLIHTEWFHCDCLSRYYRVPVWSEDFWRIAENYFRNMAAHGVNMLLTPIFTPPLDTREGGERPTVQLVDIRRVAGGYAFDFARFDRWIETARRCGIEYFEISHLFTQWGARSAPKIIVDGDAAFGWDCASDSPAYRSFLESFLPELVAHLDRLGVRGRVFFHISDEPELKHLARYRRLAGMVRGLIDGYPVCDALSNPAFFRMGYVDAPVPSVDHLDEFLAERPARLWSYYCCGQVRDVPNRFLHFPSARNRILGWLLYYYNLEGFLQWGFNFWNVRYSLRPLDPWRELEADYGFPPGDAFQVYPGEGGVPVDSVHYEVFASGLRDLRLLQLLESRISRKRVIAMLDRFFGKPWNMHDYPRGEGALLELRKLLIGRLKREFFHE